MTGASRLTTPRLVLRTMHDSDASGLHAVFGDPEVMAAFDHPPFTPEETGAWVAARLRHRAKVGFGLFAVELRETHTVIGDCGLEVVTIDTGEEVELGYDLARAYWGRGLATEAARAVVRFAFGTLGLPRIVSLIRAESVGRHARGPRAHSVGCGPIGLTSWK